MANDKTYDRHVNIWINGKEVQNDIKSIEKEMFALYREWKKAEVGSKEYNEAAKGLRQCKTIIAEHREDIKATGDAWKKTKEFFSSTQGVIMAGVGGILTAYESIKGILTSTGSLSDKLEVTLGGWKSGIDAIKRSIAELDFKNFTKNIKSAIDEGRRYAENLDEIDEKTRALMIAEAKADNELIEKRKIQGDVRKSLDERNKAGKEAIKLEEDLAAIRIGIADQAFQNELENLTKIANPGKVINDQMKEEIKLYVSRNDQFMKSLEPGQKYRALLQQISDLRKQEVYSTDELGRTTKLVDKDQEVLALQKQITDEMIRSNEILTRVTLPTDEKYQLLADKWVASEKAKGSAAEDTLKIFIKNANIENQLSKDQSDAVNKRITEYANLKKRIQDVSDELDNYFNIQNIDVQTNEGIDKTIKDKRAKQLQDLDNQMEIEKDNAFAEIELQQQKNEILRRNEISEAEKSGADINLINQKYAKLDLELEEKKDQTKLEIAAGSFGNMATLFGKQTAVGKAAAIAETTINTYSSATAAFKALAGIPVVGPALGVAAAAAAIAAGLANIKKIMDTRTDTASYAFGGFTGKGGKYEAAGLVHRGEYVIPSEIVAQPQWGGIITALEQERKGLMGYSNGGEVTDASFSTISDDMLKILLNQTSEERKILIGMLINLQQNGVKNVWTWQEVNNMRKAMDNLEEVESNVSF